jgi:hypothetical protein
MASVESPLVLAQPALATTSTTANFVASSSVGSDMGPALPFILGLLVVVGVVVYFVRKGKR